MKQEHAIFDGHNDLLTQLWLSSEKDPIHAFINLTLSGHLDLKRCNAAGWVGGLFSIFLPPYGYVQKYHPEKLQNSFTSDFTVEQIIEICTAQLMFAQELQSRSLERIQICTSVKQIKNCQKLNKLAMVLHMEGAEILQYNMDLLDVFYEAGLRSIGPLWNRKSAFGNGLNASFPSSPNVGSGLTNKGKALIRQCVDKNMLIDVSHMNEQAFWDTIDLIDQPIVATHSNAHHLCPQARNLTDQQLSIIKESEGLVGVNFDVAFLRADGQRNTATSLNLIIDHICYLMDHLGENHVAFGSDFDGALLPDELQDVSGMPRLINQMRQRGFSTDLIDKICCENWLGVLERIW